MIFINGELLPIPFPQRSYARYCGGAIIFGLCGIASRCSSPASRLLQCAVVGSDSHIRNLIIDFVYQFVSRDLAWYFIKTDWPCDWKLIRHHRLSLLGRWVWALERLSCQILTCHSLSLHDGYEKSTYSHCDHHQTSTPFSSQWDEAPANTRTSTMVALPPWFKF